MVLGRPSYESTDGEFTLESYDEGYGATRSLTFRGTYDKSFTWLEASILRGADQQKIDSLLRPVVVTSCSNET